MMRAIFILFIMFLNFLSPMSPLYIEKTEKIGVQEYYLFGSKISGITIADIVQSDLGEEIVTVTESGSLYVLNESQSVLKYIETSLYYPNMFKISLDNGKNLILLENRSGNLLIYDYETGLSDLGITGKILAVGNFDGDSSQEFAFLDNLTSDISIYDFDTNTYNSILTLADSFEYSEAYDIDSDNIDELIVANYSDGISTLLILKSDGTISNKGEISDQIACFSLGHFLGTDKLSLTVQTIGHHLYLVEDISKLEFSLKVVLDTSAYTCDAVYDGISDRYLLAVSDKRGMFLDLNSLEFISGYHGYADDIVVYNESIGAIFVKMGTQYTLLVPHISDPLRVIYADVLASGDLNGDGKNDIAYGYNNRLYIRLAEHNPLTS